MKKKRKKPKEKMITFRNHEGYSDPTVYKAIKNLVKTERRTQPNLTGQDVPPFLGQGSER